MADNRKSKNELIQELEVLRKHVLQFEAEKQRQNKIWREKEKLELSLNERVKELNCLYGIARLIEQHQNAMGEIFQGVTELLPISWQYPEITSCRIIFRDREYKTHNFRTSKWEQSAVIYVKGEPVGMTEVYYAKKMPEIDEGPFLNEERLLIDAVSERLGKAVERIEISHQLEKEKDSLKKTNIALHEVLDIIQSEKKVIGASIQANVDKIIFPIMFALEHELNPKQKKYITLLKQNFEDILSPYADRIMHTMTKLTPVETIVCNMIKNGLTTKEIASMRGVSSDTVNRHREHIRRKLGLTNKKINLVSYLSSASVPD